MSCCDDTSGCFAWYDYDTADAEPSKAFYTALIGWELQAWSPEYAMFTAGAVPLGGFRQKSEQAVEGGCPNAWVAYVSVKCVYETVDLAVSLGAKVHVDPTDIPDGGRFAIFQDPQGAFIAVHASDKPAPPKASMDTPGQVGWHELATADLEEAWAFYSQVFGWKLSQDMALPPELGGTYRLFHCCGDNLGGMFSKSEGMPSHWLLYFRVADMGEALARAEELGAKLVHGPMEVPGGDQVAQFLDPQGAAFALVAPGASA